MKKNWKRALFCIIFLIIALVPMQTFAAKAKNVATLTIVSNDNGLKDFGHAFLVITNQSSKALKVGPYRLGKNQQVTLGMRDSYYGHLAKSGGAYYNVEAVQPGVYKSFAYKTIPITSANISTISGYFQRNSYYENAGDLMFHNCTTFAVRAWNKVAPQNARLEEDAVDEPWKLKERIKKMSGGKTGTTLVGSVLKKALTSEYVYYLNQAGNVIPYRPVKTGFMSIKVLNCNQLKLTWKQARDTRISGQDMVTGYKIYYATGENATAKTITIDKQKTTQYTLKGLDAGQRYVFKIVTVFKKHGYTAEGQVSSTMSKTTANCKVTLNKKKATIDMSKSATVKLQAKSTGSHSGALKTVKWKSSNTNVATVSSSGVVTGKSSGTAVITATIHGKTASCTITVKADDWRGLYYNFLKKAQKSYSYKEGNYTRTETARSFYLLHMNDDSIPELIVSKETYNIGTPEAFCIFTVKNGKVAYCGSVYNKGASNICYNKKYKAVSTGWWTNGVGGAGEALWKVKNGKLVQYKYAYDYYDGNKRIYKTGNTQASSKKVTAAAAKTFAKKYFNSKNKVSGTRLQNTESVRLKQFKK